MTAQTMIGYYCPDCHQTWRQADFVMRQTRDSKHQFHCYAVPVCDQGHDMTEVDLCLVCAAEGKTMRAYEEFNLCLKHSQIAASNQNLTALIREIGLLPGKSR